MNDFNELSLRAQKAFDRAISRCAISDSGKTELACQVADAQIDRSMVIFDEAEGSYRYTEEGQALFDAIYDALV